MRRDVLGQWGQPQWASGRNNFSSRAAKQCLAKLPSYLLHAAAVDVRAHAICSEQVGHCRAAGMGFGAPPDSTLQLQGSGRTDSNGALEDLCSSEAGDEGMCLLTTVLGQA